MTDWHRFLDHKLRLVAKSATTLDLGGGTPFQKDLTAYSKLFKRKSFYTLDITPTFRPSIVADIHCLPIKDKSVDGIICKAVLEHVKNPFLVAAEISRVAKPGARLLVYTPFIYPYHGNPDYKDYFRYTHDGLLALFTGWRNYQIQSVRGYFATLTNFLPAPLANLVQPLANYLDRFHSTPQVSGHFLYAVK